MLHSNTGSLVCNDSIDFQISHKNKGDLFFVCGCYPLGRAMTKMSKLRTALFKGNHSIHSVAFTFPWQLTGGENCIDKQPRMSALQCKNNFLSHDKLETGNTRRVKTQQGQKRGALFWHGWFGCAGILAGESKSRWVVWHQNLAPLCVCV